MTLISAFFWKIVSSLRVIHTEWVFMGKTWVQCPLKMVLKRLKINNTNNCNNKWQISLPIFFISVRLWIPNNPKSMEGCPTF